MDPVHDQHGGSSNNPITIKVNGVRSICIPDSTIVVMSKPANLRYYRGVITTGNQGNAVDAIVFKFKESEAADRYHRLISVYHQCVLEALGHGKGLGALANFSFLALKPFNSTFQEYIVKDGIGVDQYGRFTEDFIKLICDIVEAIEELHHLGYYCPGLKGDDIAVFKECDSVTAKLWNFRKCTSDDKEQKDADWPRLGYLILSAAKHDPEATDLYNKITSGQLYGRSILKHSILLIVRKKFENVLDLYLYVSLNYPNVLPVTDPKELKISDLCKANLMTDLDRRLFWNMPTCVTSKGSIPSQRTLRTFIKQLRVVVQHEVQFIPQEMTCKLHHKEGEEGKRQMDLERCIQKSCGELFWALHRLAAEL